MTSATEKSGRIEIKEWSIHQNKDGYFLWHFNDKSKPEGETSSLLTEDFIQKSTGHYFLADTNGNEYSCAPEDMHKSKAAASKVTLSNIFIGSATYITDWYAPEDPEDLAKLVVVGRPYDPVTGKKEKQEVISARITQRGAQKGYVIDEEGSQFHINPDGAKEGKSVPRQNKIRQKAGLDKLKITPAPMLPDNNSSILERRQEDLERTQLKRTQRVTLVAPPALPRAHINMG